MNNTYPQEQVWAAAVAAQRINGEYVKRVPTTMRSYRGKNSKPVYSSNKKLSNVTLMGLILKSNNADVTTEDNELGQKIRSYYCSMIHLIFSGEAKEFIKMAVHAASVTEIPVDSQLMPLIAALPESYKKSTEREQVKEYIDSLAVNSTPVVENTNSLTPRYMIKIIDCVFHKNNTLTPYAVNAIINHNDGKYSLVYFFDCIEWKVGKVYDVVANIKMSNSKITQFGYVTQYQNYHAS